MTSTLDDLRATLAGHADLTDSDLAARPAAVSRRVAEARTRRRAVLAGGVAAATLAVGVGALTIPHGGNDAHPAGPTTPKVDAAKVFPDTVGSERLLARAVVSGTAERKVAFTSTGGQVNVQQICSTGTKGLHVMVSLDGRIETFGDCEHGRYALEPGGSSGFRLAAGQHTARIWTSTTAKGAPVADPSTTFGFAVYDASDRVTVAGFSLDRASEAGGRSWTPDPTPIAEGAFTPKTDVYVGLISGGSMARLVVTGPGIREGGSDWMSGGASPMAQLLTGGRTYRLRIDYGAGVKRRDAHIVVYRPVG